MKPYKKAVNAANSGDILITVGILLEFQELKFHCIKECINQIEELAMTTEVEM